MSLEWILSNLGPLSRPSSGLEMYERFCVKGYMVLFETRLGNFLKKK